MGSIKINHNKVPDSVFNMDALLELRRETKRKLSPETTYFLIPTLHFFIFKFTQYAK